MWAAAQDTDVPITARARLLAQGAAEDEYRRLLYVGMTRAKDRLILTHVARRDGDARGATRFLEEMGLTSPSTSLRWSAAPADPLWDPSSALP